MSERTPFTLLEAHFALFAVDANDQPLTEVYVGGCVEKCTLDGERKEQRLEYPGLPSGRVYHADEVHSILLENVWLHDQVDASTDAPTGARMPALARNGRYQLAIVWQDDEALVWAKRIYTGVTAQPNKVEDSMQSLRLAAEAMFEFAGVGIAPAATAALPGVVKYVDGVQTVDLFYFDFETKAYSAPLVAGLVEIDYGVPGAVTIRIGGDVALEASSGQLRAAEFVATGGTFLDDEPRIEWWRNGARVASLSQGGVLATADLVEQGSDPAIAGEFVHANPGWLFSLVNARAYAGNFVEGFL